MPGGLADLDGRCLGRHGLLSSDCIASIASIAEPAASGPHSARASIAAQVENGSSVAHAEPPAGALVVDSLWVHTWKVDPKSRLCARGDEQVAGIHFDPNALYVRSVGRRSVRVFFAVAVQLGVHVLDQVDFGIAYLNGKLDKLIYMHAPDGFRDRFGDYVKLLKTIYGLRQAGRAWYELLQHMLGVQVQYDREAGVLRMHQTTTSSRSCPRLA